MPELSDYLDLALDASVLQWRAIRARTRAPGGRQEPFRPVEVILCQALFQILNPHSFGGGNIAQAPTVVHALAATLRRTPGSLTSKMLNLDGSRRHGGRHEPMLFLRLSSEEGLLARLYALTLAGAREAGLGEAELPDFLRSRNLEAGELLGQDELGDAEVGVALDEARDAVKHLAERIGERASERIAEQRIRLGQSRFAARVLANYDHHCAFCGFAPAALGRNRLLLASHVKPWRDCASSRERLDPRNGVAACPTHDAAFDAYLLGINGGLRIHRAERLVDHLRVDRVAEAWFAQPPLASALLLPSHGDPPGQRYLAHHLARFREAARRA